MDKPLTPAWTTLKPHKEQSRFFYSPARFKVLPAGRRCLEGGTLVATPYGPKPIEELKIGDCIIGYNEDREPEITTVENIFDNGRQLVYPFSKKNKKKLFAATENHRILDDNNLVVVKDINYLNQKRLYKSYPYLAHTFDISVNNSTNLYFLNCGIVTHNSGKTELAKRFLILRALNPWDKRLPRPCKPEIIDPKYFAAAPTWQQAKRIYWDHLIKLIPEWAFDPDRKRGVSNSELRIKLKSGAEIYVLGLDKPERIEGSPWDGGILDEYASMHSRVWGMHVRPALADRNGWTLFIGVPEGRNHYFDLYQEAAVSGSEDRAAGRVPLWDAFTWTSDTVLPPEEIEASRRDLDPLTFEQEMRGSFISFHGQAYYSFSRMTHCAELKYDDSKPIAIAFDFNVAPGVAVVAQEMELPGQFEDYIDENGNLKSVPILGTGFIGEVFIPRNSNTPMVARKVMKDWKHHKGKIFVYGDATGGAGGTTAIEGSDWDLVKRVFRESENWNNRVFYRVPSINPKERARVNAVNSRLKSSTGIIRMMVDNYKCPYLIKDLEGVRLIESGDGSIDKRHDDRLTHISDAAGYYISYEFPIVTEKSYSKELFW